MYHTDLHFVPARLTPPPSILHARQSRCLTPHSTTLQAHHIYRSCHEDRVGHSIGLLLHWLVEFDVERQLRVQCIGVSGGWEPDARDVPFDGFVSELERERREQDRQNDLCDSHHYIIMTTKAAT